jgi:hypothetical protein
MDTDPDRQDRYANPDPDLEKILPILPDPELIPREELIHIDNVQKNLSKKCQNENTQNLHGLLPINFFGAFFAS